MGNISKITVFIISIIILCFTLKDVSKDLIIRDTENIPIPDYQDVYYNELSYNSCNTQREFVNNVIYNMEADKYYMESYKEDANTIDVVFRNEQNNIWRYYYDKTTSYLLVFNSDYETSYKGISYIIDKKK